MKLKKSLFNIREHEESLIRCFELLFLVRFRCLSHPLLSNFCSFNGQMFFFNFSELFLTCWVAFFSNLTRMDKKKLLTRKLEK